jgi:hypothetical protein
MTAIAGWSWRGEPVPVAWLLLRYHVRIEDRPGPWRVAALRETHGRPVLRARFVGGTPRAVVWRSVGGLTVESPVEGDRAELPVNGGSAYDPARGG